MRRSVWKRQGKWASLDDNFGFFIFIFMIIFEIGVNVLVRGLEVGPEVCMRSARLGGSSTFCVWRDLRVA